MLSVLKMALLMVFSRLKRGLRQGDPLSLFLFILATEGLNNMVKTAKYNGWINGNEMARSDNSSMEITHLQYADDTLIFYDANVEQLMHLRVILVPFERVSGLHINWRKCSLFPINEVTDMEFLASMLGRRSWAPAHCVSRYAFRGKIQGNSEWCY